MKNIIRLLRVFDTAKNKMIILIFGSVVVTIFDLAGLSLLLPLVSSFFTKNLEYQIFFSNVYLSTETIVIIFSVVIILKVFFQYGIIKYINLFCAKQQIYLRNKVLDYYFRIPYSSSVEQKYSKRYFILLQACKEATETGLFCFLKVTSDIIIFFSIFLFCIFFNWKFSLALILICSVFFFFFRKIFKAKVSLYGEKATKSFKDIIKTTEITTNALKELVIFKKQSFLKNQMNKNSEIYAKNLANYATYGVLPRYVLEVVLVFSLLFLTSILIYYNLDAQSSMTILAFYGFAAFRVGPLASQIIASLSGYWNSKYVFKQLLDEFANLEKKITEEEKKIKIPTIFRKKLEVLNLNFKFKKNIIFKNAKFKIIKNKIIGIVGESGSGKSTLLNIILGLNEIQKGEIICDSKIIKTNYLNFLKNSEISFIPQDTFLFDDTIRKNILFGSNDLKKYKNVKKYKFIKDLFSELPKGDLTRAGHSGRMLSGGQKQRVSIARAMLYEKKIIVMDEPTSSLDNNSKQKIISMLKQLKKKMTIIITSHQEDIIKHCDYIYKINNKKLNLLKN